MKRPQFRLKTLMLAVTAVGVLLFLSQHLDISFGWQPKSTGSGIGNFLFIGWAKEHDEPFTIVHVGWQRDARWLTILNVDLIEMAPSPAPLSTVYNAIMRRFR